MRARDIMTHPAVTVSDSSSVKDAARLLSRLGFTAAPVIDDDGRLVGIVTEADLLRGRISPSPSAHRAMIGTGVRAPDTVGEVMSTPVESLTPGADLADAARIMDDEHIRCLPIVDGMQVVGIVTRRDLLRAVLARDDQDRRS